MQRFLTKIDGREYSTLEFTASESFDLLMELGAILGPWGVSMISSILDLGDSEELDFSGLDGKSLGALPSDILKAGGFDILVKICSKTKYLEKGDAAGLKLKKSYMDSHFAGRLNDLLELCSEILKRHYAPFFRSLGEKLKNLYGDFRAFQKIQTSENLSENLTENTQKSVV